MSEHPFSGSVPTHSSRLDLVAGLRRRALASLAVCVGWVSFTLLYLAFWAHDFTLFQSIVVALVSLLLLGGILLGAWISYGLRMTGRWVD